LQASLVSLFLGEFFPFGVLGDKRNLRYPVMLMKNQQLSVESWRDAMASTEIKPLKTSGLQYQLLG
jgi:hypothetical protein